MGWSSVAARSGAAGEEVTGGPDLAVAPCSMMAATSRVKVSRLSTGSEEGTSDEAGIAMTTGGR